MSPKVKFGEFCDYTLTIFKAHYWSFEEKNNYQTMFG